MGLSMNWIFWFMKSWPDLCLRCLNSSDASENRSFGSQPTNILSLEKALVDDTPVIFS
jgi:hypothetical protein